MGYSPGLTEAPSFENPVFFPQRIPCIERLRGPLGHRNGMFLVGSNDAAFTRLQNARFRADRECQFPPDQKGDLLVQMAVRWDDSALFKIEKGDHGAFTPDSTQQNAICNLFFRQISVTIPLHETLHEMKRQAPRLIRGMLHYTAAGIAVSRKHSEKIAEGVGLIDTESHNIDGKISGISREVAVMKQMVLVFLVGLVLLFGGACSQNAEKTAAGPRLSVVTTLFPLYDFARIIGGEKASVQLLLPPGTEAHSFEPKPSDMARLAKADLFFFTSKEMEPWAEKLYAGVQNPSLQVVDTSVGIRLMLAADEHDHHGHGKEAGHAVHAKADPHIWLDFANAEKMVGTIRDAFMRKDPTNADSYRQNAGRLLAGLAELDKKYAAMLKTCAHQELVSGGHFAFGYLAHRYGLRYRAAYGFSPSAEPSPRDLMRLSRFLKEHRVKAIFYEELIEPRVAETIAKETGVSLLLLHGAHNISREDFQAGVSFLKLMERNYDALREGLQCR